MRFTLKNLVRLNSSDTKIKLLSGNTMRLINIIGKVFKIIISESECCITDDQVQDDSTIEKYTCPECSLDFSGKAFLNIHMKKLHPNVRVIIQKSITKQTKSHKMQPARTGSGPHKNKVSTQGCQTKEDESERILPPDVASKIIKFSIRAGAGLDSKHVTFNGYEFRCYHSQRNNKYWRCISYKTCSCTLTEQLVDGTYKRGILGWASDGLTHLSHSPDFQKLVRKSNKLHIYMHLC